MSSYIPRITLLNVDKIANLLYNTDEGREEMRTQLTVLSDNEKHRIHEASLRVLSATGVRVDSEKGRTILSHAGAEVDNSRNIVRFPRPLVEESLR